MKTAQASPSLDPKSHASKVIQHARAMSEALLKARPLGGSECFKRIQTGNIEEYYAEPQYLGAIIDWLHEERRKLLKENAALTKKLAAQSSSEPEASGPYNSTPHKESGI